MSESRPPFSRLFRELKRRRVFRVGVAYAATAFVVVQAASIVFPALLLPDVALRVLVVLAIFGFPLALILAWAFEMTPEGIQRTKGPEDGGSRTGAAAWVGLGVLVALAGIGAYRVVSPEAAPHPGSNAASDPAAAPGDGARRGPIRAVAVLPFTDMSPDGDQQYFGDGLAEEILDALTRVPDLRVSSRTSSFRFRGDRVDPRAIADSLGVDAILEGSVRRAGDRLKVTAQLIDADDAFHRWSRSFERELTTENIFDVQEEIARGIVGEMQQEEETGGRERTLVRRHGTSLENYDLYLRARFHWNRRTPDELETAIGLYRRALERDSTFALAWAGLADVYVVPAAPLPPQERLPLAKEAARRALELDSTLAQAHTALAAALMNYDWAWDEAGREFRRALELDPDYATAHQWYGEWLAARGRTEEGVASARRAEELDPLSMIIVWNVARALYFDRRYEEAAAQLEKLRGLYPGTIRGPGILASIEWTRGNEETAYELLLSTFPGIRDQAGDSLRAGGIEAAVRTVSRQLGEDLPATTSAPFAQSDSAGVDSVDLWGVLPPWVGIAVGREDELLAAYERAIAERSIGWRTVTLAADPAFDPVRSDPRYRELLRRVNLAP